MTLKHQQSLLQVLLVPQFSWLANEFPLFPRLLQDTFWPSQAGKQITWTANFHHCFPTTKITFRHTYYSHSQCFTEPLKSCFSIALLKLTVNLQHRDAHLYQCFWTSQPALDNSSAPPPAAFGFQFQWIRWIGTNCPPSAVRACLLHSTSHVSAD